MPKRTREKPSQGRANLEYLRNMSEEDIARTSPPELINLPADFWDSARMVIPIRKEAISLRVDEDVLAWFRKAGPLYQSRMNAVLRSYFTTMKRSGKKKPKDNRRAGSGSVRSTVTTRAKRSSKQRD